jgi:tetratricopeptide (TPR) repeat protein
MTYIGQIYGTIKDYDNARLWYRKTIEKNYIDYMAHWFLADIYYKTGEIDNAVNEIVIAQILNRNNPRIKQQFTSIFESAKRKTDDWCFSPQVEIQKLSDNKISVAFNNNWTGYALAKAIWMYEPGYRESMGVAEGQYSTVEDRECLVSLLIGLENSKAKIKKDPQLNMLKEASENKFLNEYILYEIVLPQNPFVAYQLSEEIILGIKDYVLKVRNRK